MLGSSKTLLGTLEKVVESFTDFPSSLKSFSSGVLVGDVTQRDIRKNKSSYQLKSTSVEDQVVLIWVNTDDLKLVTQWKKDLELVEMANQVKLDDVVAAEGDDKVDQDGGDDDLGDENADSFKDSEGPTEQQWRSVLFTRNYFNQQKRNKWTWGANVFGKIVWIY